MTNWILAALTDFFVYTAIATVLLIPIVWIFSGIFKAIAELVRVFKEIKQ